MLDIILLVCIYLSASAMATWWLFQSGQTAIERTWWMATKIWFRTALVIGAFVAIALSMSVNMSVLPWLLILLVIWSAVVSISTPLGGATIELFIWFVTVLPFFLAREFVLGFPMREELVLTPRIESRDESREDMVGRVGKVLTPLKPSGTVEVDDCVYSARSFDGNFVGLHCLVSVVKVNGMVLEVTFDSDTELKLESAKEELE